MAKETREREGALRVWEGSPRRMGFRREGVVGHAKRLCPSERSAARRAPFRSFSGHIEMATRPDGFELLPCR